jgi:hypothetical protein
VLGNIINPYFPQNLMLFWEHFYTKFKVGSDFAVAVGGEWYPYTGMELLTHFPVALIAMLIGYILFVPRGGKLPEKATFFLMFVSILLAAQFRSKRFAEYFPPFAILFAAFSWQAFLVMETKLPDDLKELEPYLDADKPSDRDVIWHHVRQAAVWTVGVLLTIYFIFNLTGFHRFGIDENGLVDTIASNEPNDKYGRAMTWATGTDASGRENIPAGKRIFNCNWDDFPKLFYFNTKHRYVYGLDPNYLYSENPELFRMLQDITSGKTDDAGPIIRERFGADYVFADAKENDEMFAKLLDSGWGEMVYDDEESRILKIREQKGPPPPDAEDTPETPEEKQLLDAEENSANDEVNGNAPE